MVYIEIPEPIQLQDPKTGKPLQVQEIDDGSVVTKEEEPISIGYFVNVILLADFKWNQNWKWMVAASRIGRAFEKAKKFAELDDDDHEKLRQVLEDPSPPDKGGWTSRLDPRVARQYTPFGEAIREAKHTRPGPDVDS